MESRVRRRRQAALLIGAALLGWLLAAGLGVGLSSLFVLPEDGQLIDLSGAVTLEVAAPGAEGAPPPEGEPAPEADVEKPSIGPSAGVAPGGMRSREQWIDPILLRNIFDSSKVGLPSSGPGDVSGEGRRTDLKVTLLATLVARPETYSSALIAEGRNKAMGYAIGDPLLGEGTILRIEQKRVYLRRNDGSIEYIDMEGERQETLASREAKGGEGDEDAGITKSADNKFVVERSVIDAALANPEALASQVRVVPHKGADGEIDGYRLSGVRRGTLFEKLGIKNGDIVHSVNGRELTSTSAALDAYNTLQNERSFTFEITRRSKRQTMEYEVR